MVRSCGTATDWRVVSAAGEITRRICVGATTVDVGAGDGIASVDFDSDRLRKALDVGDIIGLSRELGSSIEIEFGHSARFS